MYKYCWSITTVCSAVAFIYDNKSTTEPAKCAYSSTPTLYAQKQAPTASKQT